FISPKAFTMTWFRWSRWFVDKGSSASRHAARPGSGRHVPQLERLEDRCVLSATADAFGKLPLAFEANVGQADAQVRFLSRGPGYTLLLADTEAVLRLQAT